MLAEQVGLHERRRERDRLPRRAQGDVADDPVRGLPQQKERDDEHGGIAPAVHVSGHWMPRRSSSTFSQRVSSPFITMDKSRISRISGYIVALSKFVYA